MQTPVQRRIDGMKRRVVAALACAALLVTLAAFAVPARTSAAGEPVAVWLTTADQSHLLQQQSPLAFGPTGGSTSPTIGVNEAVSYQQMEGFGGAFTDSAAWLVGTQLTSAQRGDLMTKLFDRTNGIGLNFLRQPIGASDFSLSDYTYDDMPSAESDPTLSHFSINHDLAYIIPLLQQALQINTKLKIMATPWSPPAWMKTSDSLIGGTLKPADEEALAQYLVKFIQAYQARGVPIYAISPQNEPTFMPPATPGMTLTAPMEASLIGAHLGPDLAAAGLNTKIFASDVPWWDWGYALSVLNDPTARPYIAGTAFHCYNLGPYVQSIVHYFFPTKGIYFTECARGLLTPTPFAAALAYDMDNLIIGATRNWASTVLKWNVALDQNSGPGWCSLIWFRDCYGLVTVNTSTHTVAYNEDYYALGHISKFVAPGAYRIDSNSYGSGNLEDVAFKNPDGSKALIVFNGAATAKTFAVQWGAQSFSYTLPAGAAATFTWSGTPTT